LSVDYPVRLYRNRKTGQRFLAVNEPNGDVIYAELDRNDKPVNAGNRFPRDEFDRMLDDLEQEADYKTVGFIFIGGEFVPRQRPEGL